MGNVRFELAGKINNYEKVFLMSNNRKYNKNSGIFHRNRFHTIVEIPKNIFERFFMFDRSSNIYRTELTWGELKKIASIETFEL